jgi:hypothetical protein
VRAYVNWRNTYSHQKWCEESFRTLMTARFIYVAVKSSKTLLVKTHGKHTTVKSPKVLNFGRFLEFKNKKNNIIWKI